MLCFFFFTDTATTEIYTLSLHDALPIHRRDRHAAHDDAAARAGANRRPVWAADHVRGRRPGQRHDHRAPVLTRNSVTVLGKELTFPIEVRTARSWAAQFLVDRVAAQRIVEPSGLRVVTVGRRALFTIAVDD